MYDVMRAWLAGSGGDFEAVAIELFRWQCERNEFLREWARSKGRLSVSRWEEIPAVPQAAYKRGAIRCFGAGEAAHWFETSGTTEGAPGRHEFATLELYEAALLRSFREAMLPDGARLPIAILTPPPAEAPHSSLVHMMETVRRELAAGGGGYYLRDGNLEAERLAADLAIWAGAGQPVMVLGTAFSLADFAEWQVREGRRVALPAGSRVMETGGFKSRRDALERDDLYALLSDALGVVEWQIVNEYGMTELSSQFYDDSLRRGEPSAWKTMPPWARVRAVDPLSEELLGDGEEGLLRVYDLANVGSALALQTEDVGVVAGERFLVKGRVARAEARGCSLGAETYLRGAV